MWDKLSAAQRHLGRCYYIIVCYIMLYHVIVCYCVLCIS